MTSPNEESEFSHSAKGDESNPTGWTGTGANAPSGPGFYAPGVQPDFNPSGWASPQPQPGPQPYGYPPARSGPPPQYIPQQQAYYPPMYQTAPKSKTLGVVSFWIVIVSLVVHLVTGWMLTDEIMQLPEDQMLNYEPESYGLVTVTGLGVIGLFVGFVLSIVALFKGYGRAWAGWALGISILAPILFIFVIMYRMAELLTY